MCSLGPGFPSVTGFGVWVRVLRGSTRTEMLMLTCSGLFLVVSLSWSGALDWIGLYSSESESWLFYEQGIGLTMVTAVGSLVLSC